MRRSVFRILNSIFLVGVGLFVPAVCWGQWTNWGQINEDGFGDTHNSIAFSMARPPDILFACN